MLQYTQKTTTSDLIENFGLFDDWEDRYRYLIDLGKDLPPMEESLKVPAHKVEGCTSQVWMVMHTNEGEDEGAFTFLADSDAHIVRGLIAILMAAYYGQPKSEIASIDVESLFRSLGLDQHLSPNRRNGFFSMVEKIRKSAV